MKLNPVPIPIAVNVMALLVVTLLVLALFRIDVAIAGVVAWCSPMAPPSTQPSQRGRHHHGLRVSDAPCAPQLSFGDTDNVPAGWRAIRDRRGGARSVVHRLFPSSTEGRPYAEWRSQGT